MNYTTEQLEIIESTNPRVKMIAVAGSGKTTTLLAKMQQDIESGILPSKMCLMTFTNKAANQLKAKVPGIKLVGTYHSVYYRLLYRFVPGFDRSIIPERIKEEELRRIIQNSWTRITTKDFYEVTRKYYDDELDINEREYRKYKLVYNQYMMYLLRMKYIDYDMIEYEAKLMFQKPEISDKIRGQYTSLYIDEFQDTNKIEKDIIDLWQPERLFVVGDAAQNIYMFRGTTIRNIEEIQVDATHTLSRTFRCPKKVTDLALQVLNCSAINYHPVKMNTTISGAPVDLYQEFSEDMPNMVNRMVNRYLLIYPPDSIAILCRTNRQIRELDNTLDAPHTMVSRQLLWDTDVGMLILLFIGVCINPNNDHTFEHFLRATKQIKTEEIDKMLRRVTPDNPLIAETVNINNDNSQLMEVIQLIKEVMPLEKKIETFFQILPLEDIYGYHSFSQAKPLENCMAAIREFSEVINGSEEEFISWAAEEDSQSLIKDNGTVKLMTVHAAKGLEFDAVIVPYLGKGSFPISRATQEEELRLMYVAFTRAKKKLAIVRIYQPDIKDELVDNILKGLEVKEF